MTYQWTIAVALLIGIGIGGLLVRLCFETIEGAQLVEAWAENDRLRADAQRILNDNEVLRIRIDRGARALRGDR